MRKIKLKLLKIFLSVLIFSAETAAMGPAFVSLTNLNDFRITELDDHSPIGTFQVTVYRQPKRCLDGSLELELRIKTEFQEKIKYNDKEIENSENGKIFTVTVPKAELENRIFYRKIELKSNNPNYDFEEIWLKIEPTVEISTDLRSVNFGKILWDGHKIISENSPSVRISYTILKDAMCEVKSENNFRLKHIDKDEFIPYSANGMTENRDISLDSNRREITINFKIDGASVRRIPYAGDYCDKITLTIKAV